MQDNPVQTYNLHLIRKQNGLYNGRFLVLFNYFFGDFCFAMLLYYYISTT